MGEWIGFIMATLAFGLLAFIIYAGFNLITQKDDVLWFVRGVLILLWIVASFAVGFPY